MMMIKLQSGAGGMSGTVGGRSTGCLLLLGFSCDKHSKARPTQKRWAYYTTRVIRHCVI